MEEDKEVEAVAEEEAEVAADEVGEAALVIGVDPLRTTLLET